VSVAIRPARHALLLAAVLALPACHPPHHAAIAPAAPVRSDVLALQRDIDAILGEPALERAYWGVLIRSLSANDTIYAKNAGKLMMPASNMKIVTLAAAADRLGWDYTYETRLLALGPVEDGTLDGDLVVVGSGDPTIGHEGLDNGAFDTWASQLKTLGIRTIRGKIIGDDNAFDDETLGPGWAWDYLGDGYAAGIGALQYHENVVWLTVTAAPTVGDAPSVTSSPEGNGLTLVNHLKTTPAGSPGSIITRRVPGSMRLELRGSIPHSAAPIARSVSVDNPTLFFVNALRAALISHGIDVQGPAADIDDLVNPPLSLAGTLLATYRSPRLSTIATRMMKFSQNLYAETLLKTIGAAAGAPTLAGGREAVRATVQSWGVMPTALVMIDGSGLSRNNLVTPEALVAILTHVDHDPRLHNSFEETLPVWGNDGTLGARSRDTTAANNARAKTGTIANVRTLSGYVNAADGERLVFSILANNFETAPDVVDRAEEAIVVRLANFRR
jgi:D-alanyl-D-alanine carboxypeptidase/D-alanyl-D-alanine-endopeptidase (penicillin-binding protein 4)